MKNRLKVRMTGKTRFGHTDSASNPASNPASDSASDSASNPASRETGVSCTGTALYQLAGYRHLPVQHYIAGYTGRE